MTANQGLAIAAFSVLGSNSVPARAAPPIEHAARSILEKNCFECHGVATTSDLNLASRARILSGGKRGPAVIPGNPRESLLLRAVRHDGELKMPKGEEPLSAREIETLDAWIAAGAPWETRAEPTTDASWWAFRPATKPALPAVTDSAWVRNPIDAFVLAALEKSALKPSAPADRRGLVRRAYYDLHGLPPSPQDVERFLDDPSPNAYESLIDRLLDSPRYGERWGRHWLDVARYADTGGFETDISFPHAWRYRDYVIKSLNDDKPYNRFVQEQIAGDEIWPDDLDLRGGAQGDAIPADKLEHLEARIGTGFYTVGPVYHEAALNGEQLRYEWLTDVADTTADAFMGLTFRCARCHDHKFDPITRRDYHALMAFFAGSEIRDIPATSKMGLFGFFSGYPNVRRVQEYQSAVRRIDAEARRQRIERIKTRFSSEVVAAYAIPSKKRTSAQKALAEPLEAEVERKTKNLDATYSPEQRDERERLITELGKAALKARFEYPTATVLAHADVMYPVHMTDRGNWREKGDVVAPAFPAVLAAGTQPTLDEPARGPFVPQRRKALAQWLTRPEHPLTARVMVNRVWQWHFGRGIVATPSNFGRLGERPSHPGLLDWLAVEFTERGWSLKTLHRLIMLSNTYRMSSAYDERSAAVDPENRLLWRMNRRRLEAEILRDAILATAGTLTLKMGGKPVVPALSEEEKLGMWLPERWAESLDPRERTRRSVYLLVKRSFPLPMLSTFDAPDPSVSCARRVETTVAPQALAMLNSDFMLEQAKAFADRLRREFGDQPEEWVRGAWHVALGRAPSAEETERLAALLASPSLDPTDATVSPLEQLCLLVLNLNEFLYID